MLEFWVAGGSFTQTPVFTPAELFEQFGGDVWMFGNRGMGGRRDGKFLELCGIQFRIEGVQALEAFCQIAWHVWVF